MNIVLEFAPRGLSARYASLCATVTAPFRAALPVLGGLMADYSGYVPLFAVCAAGCVIGLGVLSRIRDPRHRPAETTAA